DLRAFMFGQLPERVCQAVASHLEMCPKCEEAIRRLDHQTDGVIRAFRCAAYWAAGRHAPQAGADPCEASTQTTVGNIAAEPTAAPHPLPGRIAGYEVLEELGRGGMSVVYKARQAHPDRLVALKMVLAGSHSTAAGRARFLAEADAIARLRHPNIVAIYEV